MDRMDNIRIILLTKLKYLFETCGANEEWRHRVPQPTSCYDTGKTENSIWDALKVHDRPDGRQTGDTKYNVKDESTAIYFSVLFHPPRSGSWVKPPWSSPLVYRGHNSLHANLEFSLFLLKRVLPGTKPSQQSRRFNICNCLHLSRPQRNGWEGKGAGFERTPAEGTQSTNKPSR